MKKFFFLAISAMVSITMMAQYPTRVYLCGPAGPGWSTEQWPMFTNVEEDGVTPTGVYEWVGNLNDGELKLLYGSSYEPGYAAATENEPFTIGTHAIIDRPDGSVDDNKWVVTANRYKIVLTLADSTLTVSDGTGLEDKNGENQSFKPAVPANVYPVGDGTQYGWNEKANEPIAKSEGADVFDGVIFLKNGEFKLLHQPDWGAQYGPVEHGEIITGAGEYSLCKPSGDNKWKIEGIEDLTAFHMIADVEAGTLVLRDTTVVIPPCTTLYMCGDAVGGWSFDENAIELTSEDSIFTYQGPLYDGEFKFFEKKDFGSQAWGASEAGFPVSGSGEFDLVRLTEDNKFYMTAGDYELTVNLKTGKMTVVYTAPSAISNQAEEQVITKRIEAGQLIIHKNGVRYNAQGAVL